MTAETKTKRPVPILIKAVSAVIAAFISVLILVVFPFAGIRRVSPFATTVWQELAVFGIAFIGAAVGMVKVFCAEPELRRRLLRDHLQLSNSMIRESVPGRPVTKLARLTDEYAWVIGLVFFFLYCASIALCMRLHVMGLDFLDPVSLSVVRCLGVALLLLGVAIQIKSIFVAFAKSNQEVVGKPVAVFHLRHPVLCGWLIIFAALPLAFAVWMPEAAIPGILVALNWFAARQELSLEDRLGDEFRSFCSKTWRIVPIGKPQ